MTEQRTDWLEEEVARLFGVPLTAETVLLKPTRRNGEEVCDILLVLRRDAIVVSMKNQKDPASRQGRRLLSWCAKKARRGIRQVLGAMSTIQDEPFSCRHRRRGQVHIPAGTLNIQHALIILEAPEEVALPSDMPDSTPTGVPIAYLSTADAVCLVTELRAFPDLSNYLDARRMLPPIIRTTIGHERLLYEYYFLGERFDSAVNIVNVREVVAARQNELRGRLQNKHELDKYAAHIERVSDLLATEGPDHADGLDAARLRALDVDPSGTQYLRLQEELCDLQLEARQTLGRALAKVQERIAASPGGEMGYLVVPDAKPGFVYVVASSRGLPRQEVFDRALILVRAALAEYGRSRGMVIVDRDGIFCETAYVDAPKGVTPPAIAAGRQLFGNGKARYRASQSAT